MTAPRRATGITKARNDAAKALREAQNQPQRIPSGKDYSRKVKHPEKRFIASADSG